MPDTLEDMPPKIKAEDNPWYLLATVYGVPPHRFLSNADPSKLQSQNRAAWNRYIATVISEKSRIDILKRNKEINSLEFTPFNNEELSEFMIAADNRFRKNIKSMNFDFNDFIEFSDVEFEKFVDFRGYIFPTFSVFNRTTFLDDFLLEGVIFTAGAYFSKSKFNGHIKLNEVLFNSFIIFDDCAFLKNAEFSRATFQAHCSFIRATFESGAIFDLANFYKCVDFEGTTFARKASFDQATFSNQTRFVNAKFDGPASFTSVKFISMVPEFFGATLHEGTLWNEISWPPVPVLPDAANKSIAAYERLKLEMDRLKKHEDELNFFALEMQCRRVKAGYWAGLPIAFYGAVCDYGRDYAQPLWLLWLTAWIGTQAALLTYQEKLGGALGCIGFSIASTFGALGLRKEFFDSTVLHEMPWPLVMISAGQTLAGIIFLFFFGLAVRNRFRMK